MSRGDRIHRMRLEAECKVMDLARPVPNETAGEREARLMRLENWRGRYAAYDYALELIDKEDE